MNLGRSGPMLGNKKNDVEEIIWAMHKGSKKIILGDDNYSLSGLMFSLSFGPIHEKVEEDMPQKENRDILSLH